MSVCQQRDSSALSLHPVPLGTRVGEISLLQHLVNGQLNFQTPYQQLQHLCRYVYLACSQQNEIINIQHMASLIIQIINTPHTAIQDIQTMSLPQEVSKVDSTHAV
ncbi:hypothetical protein CHARACLAT_027526 [Characodon lateralis]|uniref:Uncharacterized protein n=1 Tax=Characodon lateralis TaxID=208331 RepID=A0ABU7DAJ3_9TELE|nr:hypothetical protein [Characodon lateralis]